MARTRRNSAETLELKIELAEKKAEKTRIAHEKAIGELKKLYDIRRAKQRDMILKALENSAHSLDEILTFINSPKNDEEEADA